MKIGMMWLIDKNRKNKDFDLVEQVGIAHTYYFNKYNHRPDMCRISPVTITQEEMNILVENFADRKMDFKFDNFILKNCIWVGEEERTAYRGGFTP